MNDSQPTMPFGQACLVGPAFLAGGGRVADIIATRDWSATPLGPIEAWPISIRTTVGLMLRSPVPIVTLWGEQGIMIYNDAYSVFAGRRHPKLLGSAVREGWPEVAAFNDNVMKVGLGGGVLSYQDQELTLFRSGVGEQVWMNLDYSPVIGEDDLPIGVIAIVVETTGKVAAERAREQEIQQRQAAQARQQRLFEQAPGFIIIMRGPGHVVEFVNDKHRALFGSDDWPGKPIRTAFPSLAGQGYFEHLDRVYRTGQLYEVQGARVQFRRDDDSSEQIRSLTFIYAPLYGDDGNVAGVFCEGFDVTEMYASEQRFREALEAQVAERTAALQQSEANLRAIYETSHLYQGLMSIDGTLQYANTTSLAAIKTDLADVVGLPFWDTPWLTGTTGASDTVKAAVTRVASGVAENFDMTLNLPIGSRSFAFSLRPVKNDAGKVVAIVPEAVDTTARVQAEQTLLQVQKMEAIGKLTGGIAHDFNNLLMAVISSLELLRKRMPDDPGLLRLVSNALEGARRGGSLTSRMLTFARRQDLKSGRIDLPHLVDGMRDLMQRALGPMVTIETRFPPTLAEVETDQNQLEAALLNLVVNARDAIHGEGTIVIAAREEQTGGAVRSLVPGRYVCLSVTDSGEGMDEATLRHATEPFFTTKGIGKGTGLGLSMVHGLAEQSGGTLILKSVRGQGTTAEIWLPALTPLPDAAPPPVAPQPIPAAAAPARSLIVLAVDDDALVLMNTVDMLEDLGHTVAWAHSGKQALELIETQAFDIVVTDHAMPQMTGSQLATELRKRRPQLPILLATGYAELPRGSTMTLPQLSKPFSQAQLADAMHAAMVVA